MKVALVCGLVLVSIALTSAALTCYGDKDKCAEDECCVQVGNTVIGTCKKLKAEGERCEVKQLTHLLRKHVHLVMCPCGESMTCIPGTGMIGKQVGSCQESSGEETNE